MRADILKNYRDSLEKLAGILLKKESIEGEELQEFAEEVGFGRLLPVRKPRPGQKLNAYV
jgi:hypothetical protein